MHKRKELKTRILSALMSVAMVLSILPPVTLPVRAAGEVFTFDSGAVLLDESYSGDYVIIRNGVFSVAVNGAQDVTVIFDGSTDGDGDGKADGITIDHRAASDPDKNSTVPNLYNVSSALGWGTTAQTCPFLITGNSTVIASFRGPCTFYAGTNACTVSTNNTYTVTGAGAGSGAGFAGIQVDSGSSLTIAYAEDLKVYGAHQLGVPDADGTITANGVTEDYSDVLRGNSDIQVNGTSDDYVYNDPWDQVYKVPDGATVNSASGGAGIGGGAAYDTGKTGGIGSGSSSYTAGTPGTIIINGGNIEAFGGHQAAGIGGGVNSSATSDKIVVNGGTVTAHGGRWAAGIGDGDSVSGGASTTFDDECLVEINGGTVTAYGGVAAPGIGCTDEFADNANVAGFTGNGLEIAINGGSVSAFSGFPHNFSGQSYQLEAPAAIGAGSKSTMAENSIYISSAADLSCAGFGNYSLTEDGTNANEVPTINIDSDGYLLLLRTTDEENGKNYHSTETRKLNLYAPQTTELEGVGTVTIYVSQPDNERYYVDKNTGTVYDQNGGVVSADAAAKLNLTLYVDENSTLLESIELAYYFRSIALTMPDPKIYGGLYALQVPTDGMPDNVVPDDLEFITLTVEAYEQGTQSGWIEYPSEHNLGKDAVSMPLKDLDVNGDAVDPGLIGDDFYPNVYAYTVYFPADAEEVDLYAAFDRIYGTNSEIQYTVKLDGNTLSTTESGTQREVKTTVSVAGVDQKTVRLTKQDSSIAALSYKITLIRMGDYKLDLTDPSKVYDGQPAESTPSMVYTGSQYKIEHTVTSSNTTDQTLNTAQLNNASGNLVCNRNGSGLLQLTQTLKVIATNDPNVIQYVFSVKPENAGSMSYVSDTTYRMGWKFTYDPTTGTTSISQLTTDPENVGSTTWIGNGTERTIAYRRSSSRNPVYLTATTDTSTKTATVVVNYNNSNQQTLLEINAPTVQGTSSNTKAEAEQKAQNALSSGAVSGTFAYETEVSLSWSQQVLFHKLNNSGMTQTTATTTTHNVTNNYGEVTQGKYDIVPNADDVAQITVPEEDLKNAVLTYYRKEADDSYTKLDGPPTDVGNYRVDGEIHTKTYNASGSRVFTITPRPITVLQIENWLTYLTSAQVAELQGKTELNINEPGNILLDNVVSGDTVTVTAASVYYNDLSVTYGPDKITLTGLTLGGEDAHNYSIADPQTVFGQIAYNTEGAIFRKTETGDWRKYYPVDHDDPVNASTSDYHSPADDKGLYTAHAEYVKARTVNEGSRGGRYAVDIEYGPMQFNFYRSVWNVNELIYEELTDSQWTGMDGTNNKLTLTNYSNRSVWYRMDAEIDFLYADISGTGVGITARVTTDAAGADEVTGTVWSDIPSAEAGTSTSIGTEKTSTRYLMLSGVPQMPENILTTVGAITVYVSPTDPGSG